MTAPPPFKRRVVRASRPSWSSAPTSGAGAARHGGRFNPKGTPALYTSFDFATCANEVRFSLNTDPYTFYQLEVESARIADLSASAVREKLQIGWSNLECRRWESEMNRGLEPAPHKVAARLFGMGYHGIVVPSFAPQSRPDGLNLVLWQWKPASERGDNVAECAWVTVLSPALLPRDRSSWDQ